MSFHPSFSPLPSRLIAAGILAVLVFLVPLHAAEISLGSQPATPGSSVVLPVSFRAQGDAVAAVQFDLEYDSSIMDVSALFAEAGRNAQKNVYVSDLAAGKRRFLIAGLNGNLIPSGALVTVFVNLRPGVAAGFYALILSHLGASDPNGQEVPLTAVPGTVVVQGASTAVPLRLEGVVNAASLMPGAVAPGEVVTLIGSAIGPAIPAQNAGTVFGTILGGTRVLFNDVAAPLLYVSSNQINAIVPFAMAGTSSALLTIEFQGQKVSELLVPVTEASPALFTSGATGAGQAALVNQDSTLNSPDNPAPRGSVVALYATGAGQTDPPGTDALVPDRVFPRPVLPVSVQLGGQAAQILYVGAAPGIVSGVIQINCIVPVGVAPGQEVPLVIQFGSTSSPNGVTLAIQ